MLYSTPPPPPPKKKKKKKKKDTWVLFESTSNCVLGDTAGVVVVVHKNTEMPFPEEEGVFALPGRSTDIAISMVSGTTHLQF